MSDVISALTADELRVMCEGCTEAACPWHGVYVAELVDRGESLEAGS